MHVMLFDYYTGIKMEPSNLSRYDAFNYWVQNDGIRRITKSVITKQKSFCFSITRLWNATILFRRVIISFV